jgi:proteasome lid subunit RPN8/RPN11
MTPDVEVAIREHAVSTYPREACGLVVVERGAMVFRPCRNVADSPNDQFILHAEDYAAAEDAGEITALVHSHPEASPEPSAADKVACEASGLPWIIVEVRHDGHGTVAAGQIVMIEPQGYQAPLVGRPFTHGILDCYALIKDWYARERGIALPDFERRDEWWNDGHSALYMDHFREAGFEQCNAPLLPGDVILMQIRSKNDTPNHAGVYLGDGQMLHHPYKRLSTRDVYGGMWKEYTRLAVRHVYQRGE